MNDRKYSPWGDEEASNCMEWEGDSNLVRFDICADEASTSYCLPNTLGGTSRKRKADFSSSLPMKIARNSWNGENHEDQSYINELHKKHVVASGFSIDKFSSQMTMGECHHVLGEVSDNVSAMSVEHSNVYTVPGQSNSRTFQTHPDLEIREEIFHPPHAEQHTIEKKEKPYICPICHTKWNLKRTFTGHVMSHKQADESADTKHF